MYEQFKYLCPKTKQELWTMLQEPNALVFGGGTDLFVILRSGKASADYVIDIKRIAEFHDIWETDESILIGSTVSLTEIQNSDLVNQYAPALVDAVSQVGSVQIRNKATLAGNIQAASPAGDGLTGAFGLNSSVILESRRGKRVMSLEDFMLDRRRTAKAPDEVITAIEVPKKNWSLQKFFKVGRRNAMAISVVNGLVAADMDDDIVKDIRISLGAVAPTPIRIREAEQFLIGKALTDEVLSELAGIISGSINPVTDIRAGADYRKYISGIMVKRQLEAAGKV